ncbi:MAG: hypothetical protein LUF82_02315 [Clostridia bacterium]|nr:hypothetical protein [Clostridia bacterium]
MKKSFKILLTLLLCVVMAASVAGFSACSVLLSVFEDDESSSSGGSSGGSSGSSSGSGVSGTYTVDLSLYDEDWYNNVVDSTMWSTTAGVGAYAYDTLVLNSDGTYALTKEMGADEVATEHWSTDNGATDKHFSTYTYYGTYTAASDGVTITLSEVTSIAYEVDTFEISISQGVGYVIEYTETTDLESTAGTLSGDTVIDLYYGIYLVNSGYGNCSQVITLGTTDYGDFAFSGLASSGDEGDSSGDTGDSGSTSAIPSGGYTFTSGTNSDIIFNVYADGSYVFAWEDYDVVEEGTYTWDRLTQTLVFTDPNGTETTATISGDDISFTYYYSLSSSLTQDYTGSVEEMEDVICEVLYELIPAVDSNVSLCFYSDGTYTYTDGTNSVSETGTYNLDALTVTLTLTLPDGETTIESTYSGNILTITYTTSDGKSSQQFLASVAEAVEKLPSAEVIYSFTPGSGNSAIYLDLYDDGTYEFGFTTYGVTQSGTYTYVGGNLVFSSSDTTTITVTTEDGVISAYYDYMGAGQLTQTFIGSVTELNAALDIVYNFTPGSGNTAIYLTLYTDYTYEFGYSTYGVTESGTWSYIGGNLAFTPSGTTTITVTTTDGAISAYYDYMGGGQLTQTFIGSTAEINEALGIVYNFTPGSGNSAIYLTLYTDYTYEFGYSTYGVTESGSWAYVGGNLSFTPSATTTITVTTDGDAISAYYDYMGAGQLTQTFIGSIADLNDALGIAYSFTPGSGNTAIYLDLYTDGTYEFGFATYGVTEGGTWLYANGSVIFTPESGSSTAITVTVEDGVISAYYDYMSLGQLTQTFTGSAADIQAAAGIVYSLTPGSGNAAIYLNLYEDGTYQFGFATYGVTEGGTWLYANGSVIFTPSSDSTTTITVTAEDGTISAYYDYAGAGQLTQTFTGSATDIQAAAGIAYSFTPGSGNSAIYLNLYTDGTYEFGFTTYGVTESGTWTYINGSLSFTSSGTTTITVTTEDGTISAYYDYMGAGQLTQTFTGTVDGLCDGLGIAYEFTPGSGNSAIYLTLYTDGTYEFGFTTYGVTESGTWTYTNGTLAFTSSGTTTITVTEADGTISAYYDYMGAGQLTQTFTGSASDIKSALEN